MTKLSHRGLRRSLFAVLTAVGALCALLLIGLHGAPWIQGLASGAAFVMAMAVIVAGELGWSRSVASARRAGLVAPAVTR